MINKTKRGFTLIELLVVIAIIGILSSVVLASLNTARAKGADAAVKSNLNNIRAQAELYYDTNSGSYATLCTADSNVNKGVTAALSAGGSSGTVATRCSSSSTAWAAWSELKSTPTNSWCVDSTGTSKLLTTNPSGAITVCP